MSRNPATGYKVVTGMMAEMAPSPPLDSARLVNSVYWTGGESDDTRGLRERLLKDAIALLRFALYHIGDNKWPTAHVANRQHGGLLLCPETPSAPSLKPARVPFPVSMSTKPSVSLTSVTMPTGTGPCAAAPTVSLAARRGQRCIFAMLEHPETAKSTAAPTIHGRGV